MPTLVNKNAHPIRVTDSDGVQHRLVAGQVVDLDGAAADAVSGTVGVESASAEDKSAWEARLSQGRFDDADGDGFDNIVADARRAVAEATVVAPLNTVIGDSAAPHGPPTGTITTKQAVVRDGDKHDKKAFGDHEHLPEAADDESLSHVERKQAAGKAAVEELTAEVAPVSRSPKKSASKPKDDDAK